jgi:RNA polymerase sigma-70 factor (ECF subfamily)
MLVDQHTAAMLRIARNYVRSAELAEDVVQETWIAVLKGINNFQGRSSLRTWVFAILINTAKRRGVSEQRHGDSEIMAFTGGTVDRARFRDADDPYPGHWRESPCAFPDTPEGSILGKELTSIAAEQLALLPERQRIVVTLRDLLGFEADEVCEMLDLSLGNQRVLLHRGRAAIRAVLEDYLQE